MPRPSGPEYDLGFDPDTSNQEIESVTDYYESLKNQLGQMVLHGQTGGEEFRKLQEDIDRLEEEMGAKRI